MVPHGSVYQSYTNAGQSSDRSGPVGACRVILSGSDGFSHRNLVLARKDPTGLDGYRLTVPYWCTIDVWTHRGPYGVPTGPPGPHWDPTGIRRTAEGTVGPCLIGASLVWAARHSYWRSRVANRNEGSGNRAGPPRSGTA